MKDFCFGMLGYDIGTYENHSQYLCRKMTRIKGDSNGDVNMYYEEDCGSCTAKITRAQPRLSQEDNSRLTIDG